MLGLLGGPVAAAPAAAPPPEGTPRAAPAPGTPARPGGGDEEVIDDPQDDARPAPSARPGAGGAARPGARPGSGGVDEEVIDDPEDRPAARRPADPRRPSGGAAPAKGATPEAAAFVPRVSVGGYLQLWSGFDVRYEGRRRGDETDLRPSEDIFELLLRARLHAEARFKRWVKVRLEARLDYWVTAERPDKGNVFWFGNGQAWTGRGEVELGEAYVDLYLGPVDLRLGQQIISWGLTELLNPNEVVNPIDLRRGLLGGDEDRRLPVLAARAAWHIHSFKLEAVWLPLFRPHRFDVWGSDFALLGPGSSSRLAEAEAQLDRVIDPTLRGPVGDLLTRTRPPREDPSASSVGLRFSGRRAGWDFGVQYFFGWDRTPGLQVESDFYRAAMDGELFLNGTLNIGALGALIAGSPLFVTEYHHGHQVGLSVGKAFEDFSLKLDVAYFPDRGFLRTDRVPEPLAAGLVDLRVEHHTLVTALSAEYAWGTTLLVQLQGFHAVLLDRRADDPRELMGFLTERNLALVLGLVRVQLLRETLLLTLAGAVDVLHGSFLLAPTVAYKVTDAWRLSLGAMVFEGKANTPFGGWNKNDLVWLDARWSF